MTTHPIEVPVEDTKTAFSNFDGITYGKGASVLKQLDYFIGQDNFKNGIQYYFNKHAGENTELKDFFDSMEYSSKKDLSRWVEQWLMNASLNTITPTFSCEKGVISSFKIKQQSEKGFNELREHRTIIGLFNYNKDGKLSLSHHHPFSYAHKLEDVPGLEGLKCPTLVFLNYQDKDYVKTILDPKSLSIIKENINDVADVLTRNMLWQTLWDMVRDGKLKITQYADILINNLPKEKDYKVFTSVLRRTSSIIHYLQSAGPDSEISRQYKEMIEEFLWENLHKAKPGSDFQKSWFDGLVAAGSNKKALKRQEQLLNGIIKIDKMEIDQDRRWDIIISLNMFSYPGSQKLINHELLKDGSDKGQKSALYAQVVRPDLTIKKKWFNEIIQEKSNLPLSKIKVVMRGLFPISQATLQKKFKTKFYDHLNNLIKTKDSVFLRSYSGLVPLFCDQINQRSLETYLDNNNNNLPPIVLKNLKINHQEDGRCQKIIALIK